MPDCEYCAASFETEEEYLEHLGEDHWGELGRIDRRRVEDHRGGGGGISRVGIAIAAMAVFVAGVLIYVTFLQGAGEVTRTEQADLPDNGAAAVIANSTEEPDQSREHVSRDTDVDYQSMPPSGGPHYDGTASAGFYEEGNAPALGDLVHSLEHGAVVVWYDPAEISADAEESLRAWARNFQDDFGSIIAAPNPVDDPEAPYVLTAWEHRLTMEEYDLETVRQFAAEYLGRGPERQIR